MAKAIHTHLALVLPEKFLQESIDFEIFNVNLMKAVQGCTGCNACGKNKNEQCVLPRMLLSMREF